ncbi:MAG TPA: hypothetical protein VLD18_01835, partial [Verrucomicrobiae bacterium]|nr:hypothetical protein [Verrucomicrobiae bacterium]
LRLHNRRVPGFQFEDRCRSFVRQLQQSWDGRTGLFDHGPHVKTVSKGEHTIFTVMISCTARRQVREATLNRLRRTDWKRAPDVTVLDESTDEDPRVRQTETALIALTRGLESGADYVLFLEDDLRFNRHLAHNLRRWPPLRAGRVTLASLYNPGVKELACDVAGNALLVEPSAVFGSQALLISRATLAVITSHWRKVPGMQDIRIARLAGRLKRPVLYHAPSLVQHAGEVSTWGGGHHRAPDFDVRWRA